MKICTSEIMYPLLRQCKIHSPEKFVKVRQSLLRYHQHEHTVHSSTCWFSQDKRTHSAYTVYSDIV